MWVKFSSNENFEFFYNHYVTEKNKKFFPMADHAYYHHHQKCGEKGVPSIYTRVSKYLDWIEKNMT